MIINTNIVATVASNNLKKRTGFVNKTMKKLSSGLRINRASDDAAGLAISESMRAQIRGLHQSSRNAQDGISLLQTADGALASVNDSLHRISELIIQKQNGILQNSDKENILNEMVELLDHIDGITSNTEFNGINLFDGSFSRNVYADDNIPITINNMDLGLYYKENFDDHNKFSQWFPDAGRWSVKNGGLRQGTLGIGDKTILSQVIKDNEMTITVDAEFTSADKDGNVGIIIKGEDFNNQVFGWYSQYGGIYLGERVNGVYRNIGLVGAEAANVGKTYKLSASVVGDYYTFSVEGIGDIKGYSVNSSMVEGYTGVFTAFSEGSFDNYKVIPSITVEDIDKATNRVLSERSKLGAYQNRLEHAINNINNYTENLISAESRIRDADIAKQMTQLAKNQIMLQTSQAILSQANIKPESMLQMLKS
ncbi:flagellin [Paenibacillus jamilae]|jgi:flagellin|uniref:flagellin N-terminal helical domain-containing protein n=1 Tax=Paenibacillus TaxID=44249 RepID=UPI0015F2DE99|nr:MULTISPECIES: flagellin [Paenibacillus]MDP9676578.1 flagellin [Paenibacillus jamilae]KAF6619199.1 flagellin [Paenibacillus sp. EKM101P]KAF6624290.1 flagellin [Paenibacillus sp. EKM102P]KAF6635934.1 flagellin [Paenibacillus sp. EKM10P]KAF6648361.1 flagellin [Paenibacillus sp. EKM11P]